MRWPAAVVGTAALFRHHRAPALVTPVGEFYAHRYRSGIFVFPGLAGETADFYRQQAIDSFFWGYCPTVGDSVIDVGAGIGEETLTASRLVGKNGRIMAIEAHPTTFKRLELMCQLNHLDNVIPIQCAVTAQTGFAAHPAILEFYFIRREALKPHIQLAIGNRRFALSAVRPPVPFDR